MKDVLLHCLGAVGFVVAGTVLGWFAGAPTAGAWGGAIVSAAFWPLREAWQGGWEHPRDWSRQRWLEAAVPAPVGLGLALLVTAL